MATLSAHRVLTLGIVTPAPRRARTGNRITALRWARLLRGLGHRVFVEEKWSERSCDLLLALHAMKSAASIERFRAQRPGAPVVVLLAGTDLLGAGNERQRALASLAAADRIAVLQPRAIAELPEALRPKCRVIRQSATVPRSREPPAADAFEVCVLGHLRDVKDPLRAALAARLVPNQSRLRVVHVGETLSDDLRTQAEREMRENPRYRWLGALSHARTIALLARSRLLVLTSRSEGGANVLSEAIACSVPVLSSRIDGSLGILGDAYPGCFTTGDERELARLLRRCETDARFLGALTQWCEKLAPLVAPEHERAALARLLDELLPTARGGTAATPVRELSADPELPFTRLAADVKQGLAEMPKRLNCCWFYDAEGSRLFEEICRVPEYYVTRAEDELLAEHADAMVASLPRDVTLVELGSGSATKTRWFIDALLRRQARLRYAMIDISTAALRSSARELSALYPDLAIATIAGEYDDGLALLGQATKAPRLVLWLGSNIGNFHRDDAARFLARVRARLDASDALLVGIDLRKDPRTLERAYDDAAGVTARFNKNLLARINRELGGDFDLAAFRHLARYDEADGRVEMWLVSERKQRARIGLLDLEIEFEAGERIHTENSYKYSDDEIAALAAASGWRLAAQWFDRERRFCDVLFQTPGAAR